MKMLLTVQTDRVINPNHYLTPGRFNFKINGKDIEFDFCEAHGTQPYPIAAPHTAEARQYAFELEDLDIFNFPDSSEMLSQNALDKIEKINEIFVYTGDERDAVINIDKILTVAFSHNNKITILPQNLIDNYNECLMEEQYQKRPVFC